MKQHPPLNPDWDLEQYHFDLPPSRIAQVPVEPRDHAKMLVWIAAQQKLEHCHFYDLPRLLDKNTVVVVNNTKVINARLIGRRASGGAIEALLTDPLGDGCWVAMLKKAKRVKEGEKLFFAHDRLQALAESRTADGYWRLQFDQAQLLPQLLEELGQLPLPPYIDRDNATAEVLQKDKTSYQTCYAEHYGAVAAPTAGLHFTPQVLEQLRSKGVEIIHLTLHVGIGTFLPLRVRDIREHQMHEERYHVEAGQWQRLQEARSLGKKVLAVGSTSVRILETLGKQTSAEQLSGATRIFIHPPYNFRLTDSILTNFHLPDSSLLLLVAAFCGRERLLSLYQTALQEDYRFFSYGDCMLLL